MHHSDTIKHNNPRQTDRLSNMDVRVHFGSVVLKIRELKTSLSHKNTVEIQSSLPWTWHNDSSLLSVVSS